jgi:glutaminase
MNGERRYMKAIAALALAATLVPGAPAQSQSPVAPARAQVEATVQEAYQKFQSDTTGKNADYIPYLAQVDPKLFGIAIVTTDNQVLTLGDVKYSFSIQSISKVFTLALVMDELGPEKTFQRIGSEPTGRAFNSVNAVVDMPTHTGNPFVNAGAIATTCSVGVNAVELARMGATLANNGVNPATGEQVIHREDIPYILSAMTMAGLYDTSGSWAWHVGLPAKSGVGGGIVAVAPGKGAIAVFAPRLDEAGNSVKAQKVIEYVANQLKYNIFSPGSVGLK